jgi:uncharacterized protein YoxC
MTDERDDENVVELKSKPGKDKRSKEKPAGNNAKFNADADGMDGIMRELFGKAGFELDSEAVKYQIAQSVAQIRAAYTPIADVLNRLASTMDRMVEVNKVMADNQKEMVASQNGMVEVIQTAVADISALQHQITDLQDQVEEVNTRAAAVEDQIKYDLVAEIRRPPIDGGR